MKKRWTVSETYLPFAMPLMIVALMNRPNEMRHPPMRNARSEDNPRFSFALDTRGTLLSNATRPVRDLVYKGKTS